MIAENCQCHIPALVSNIFFWSKNAQPRFFHNFLFCMLTWLLHVYFIETKIGN